MSDFANPLSAASLVLAAIALVYSAWAPSIQHLIDRPFSPNDTVKANEQSEVRRTMVWRAIPLALASTSVLIVFAPREWDVIMSVVDYYHGSGSPYDDVAAIFFITQIFVAGLTVHLWGQTGRLNSRL